MAWFPGTAKVAAHAGVPLAPAEPIGPLLDLHAGGLIELRITNQPLALMGAVVASTLDVGGIRLANALPRPEPLGA